MARILTDAELVACSAIALPRKPARILLQHADNPVDWYPWGEQALARPSGKQAHSAVHRLFGLPLVPRHGARVLRGPRHGRVDESLFVNIKVDREERPDLDKIYQVAQQLITHGSGGWPLTMFLSPENQQPFFGGTYFPKEPRYGMPAFSDLLQRVAEYYRGHAAGDRAAKRKARSSRSRELAAATGDRRRHAR